MRAVIILLICTVGVLGYFAHRLHIQYEQQQAKIIEIATQLDEKTKELEEKIQQVNDKKIAMSSQEKAERAKSLMDSLNKQEESDTVYIIPDNKNSYVVSGQSNTCIAPGCDNKPNQDSYYCSRHECFDISCHNPKANDFCLYCTDHKCIAPDCNNKRNHGEFVCFRHSR